MIVGIPFYIRERMGLVVVTSVRDQFLVVSHALASFFFYFFFLFLVKFLEYRVVSF